MAFTVEAAWQKLSGGLQKSSKIQYQISLCSDKYEQGEQEFEKKSQDAIKKFVTVMTNSTQQGRNSTRKRRPEMPNMFRHVWRSKDSSLLWPISVAVIKIFGDHEDVANDRRHSMEFKSDEPRGLQWPKQPERRTVGSLNPKFQVRYCIRFNEIYVPHSGLCDIEGLAPNSNTLLLVPNTLQYNASTAEHRKRKGRESPSPDQKLRPQAEVEVEEKKPKKKNVIPPTYGEWIVEEVSDNFCNQVRSAPGC
uniref:C2 domain-containing protein n=1 Tax=Steinernema glaseri TaxID=37863 RepID=A0A1I7ZMB9_9BILA